MTRAIFQSTNHTTSFGSSQYNCSCPFLLCHCALKSVLWIRRSFVSSSRSKLVSCLITYIIFKVIKKIKINCSSSLNQKALGTHSVTILNQANVIQFKLQPCLLCSFLRTSSCMAWAVPWPLPANLSAAEFLLSHLQQVDRLPLVRSHDGQCQSHDKHRSYYFCFQ